MILKNNFFFFKSALTERQCNNIITVGLSKMEIAKDKDGDKAISAATFDNKEKGGTLSTERYAKKYTLKGVYPASMGSIAYDVSNQGDIVKLSLTLGFQYVISESLP